MDKLQLPFKMGFTNGKEIAGVAEIVDGLAIFKFSEKGLAEDFYQAEKRINPNVHYDREKDVCIETFVRKTKFEIYKIIEKELQNAGKK